MIVIVVISLLGGGAYYLLTVGPVQSMIGKRVLNQISKRTNSEFSVSKMSFHKFKELELNNLFIKDEYNDTLLYSSRAVIVLDSVSRSSNYICFQSLTLESPVIKMAQKDSGDFNFMFIIDSLSNPDKPDSLRWTIKLEKLKIEKGEFELALQHKDTLELHNMEAVAVIDKHFMFIEQLGFNMNNGFNLKDAYADIRIDPQSVKIPHLSLTTSNSTLIFRNIMAESKDSLLKNTALEDIRFALQSNNSMISGRDISYFLSEDYHFDNSIVLNGNVKGNLNQIVGSELQVKIDSIMDFSSNFEIDNLLDFNKFKFDIEVKELAFDVEGLGHFYNKMSPKRSVDIEPYAHWEKLAYEGNISGGNECFSSIGQIKTVYGTLNTDIFVFMYDSLQTIEYNGDISTNSFHLGNALQDDELYGDISAELFVSGGKFSDGKIGNYFKGDISSLTIKDYKYSDITIQGGIGHRSFNGKLVVNDENAKFNFSGNVDFMAAEPTFNFNLDMEHLAMSKINLTDSYDDLNLTFNLDSKLKGSNIDNLNGYLNVSDLLVHSEHNNFKSDTINCEFKPLDAMPSIVLSSDYINGLILGSYNFTEFLGYFNSALRKHIEYLPSIFDEPENETPNDFTFAFEVNDLQDLAKTLDFPLRENGFSIVSGSINSNNNTFELEGEIPYILTKKQLFNSVSIAIHNNDSNFTTDVDIQKFTFADAGDRALDNITINCGVEDNLIKFSTEWENEGIEIYKGDYKANIWFEPYGKDVNIIVESQPSEIIITDTLWHLNRNQVTFYPHKVIIDSLKFESNESSFLLDGTVSHKITDTLDFSINQFNLSNLDRLLSVKNLTFGGIMSGDAKLYSLMSNPVLISDIQVDDVSVNHSEWGNFKAKTQWDNDGKALNLFASCELPETADSILVLSGKYFPKIDSLDVAGDFNGFDVGFLQPYLERTMSNFKGYALGHLNVEGSILDPTIRGALMVDSGGFIIDYLSTQYYLNDSIKFDDHRFIFDNIEVQDQDGNLAYVNGDVKHTGYKNMIVDLMIESDRFLGMNTTALENEYFYGDIYFDGAVTIRSTNTHTYIGSNAKTHKDSHLTVPLSPVSKANSNDFIKYINTNIELEDDDNTVKLIEEEKPQKQLVIDMDFNITSDASLRLEFDAKSGDVIEAVGSGNLNVQFQQGQPFQLFGDYTIDNGYYYFTLEQIFNKKFDIISGSTMRWSGRPGDAIVDITGQYSTRASLYNLMPDAIDESNKNRHIPVNVKMYMTEQLSKPNIAFDIELPNTDTETQQSVSSIINTEEEMSRQVLSLLITNSFYTPDYYTDYSESSQANNQISSMAAVTVSEFLTNQLGKWMSHISDNLNLGLRYIPEQELTSEGMTPEEVEVAISTQFFNDRLSVNGNVGYQNYEEADRPPNMNSNFVGEIDVLLKISNHLNLKAYSHQNDDILYENSNMKQGAGISYKEDFSTFKELGGRYKQRIGNVFKKKDKRNSEAVERKEEELGEEDKTHDDAL